MGFSNAPQTRIAPVATALNAAQVRVAGLIFLMQAILAQDLGSQPQQIAANLQNQQQASAVLPQLYALGSVLSRMASNINAAGQGGNTKTLIGGDLSFLAAKVYGDATAWTTIARANDLLDPVLQGENTLTVPPTPDGADGVFYQ